MAEPSIIKNVMFIFVHERNHGVDWTLAFPSQSKSAASDSDRVSTRSTSSLHESSDELHWKLSVGDSASPGWKTKNL